MTLKIPKTFAGKTEEEMKAAYERVISRPDAPVAAPTSTNQIVLPNQDLQFITDENLYNEIIKYLDKTFPNHKETLLGKLSFDNVMKGSNPCIAVAVDMYLKSINFPYRIATQRDLETNLQMFKEEYEDTGLVLRSLEEPNKSQAEHLYNQLKQRSNNIKFPIFLDLRGLTLGNNLNFNLTDESRYKTAECLNWENETHYSQVDDFGLPSSKDKKSSRQIWTIKDGLSRACLDRNSGLYSGNSYLSNSNDYGRVVLAKSRSG